MVVYKTFNNKGEVLTFGEGECPAIMSEVTFAAMDNSAHLVMNPDGETSLIEMLLKPLDWIKTDLYYVSADKLGTYYIFYKGQTLLFDHINYKSFDAAVTAVNKYRVKLLSKIIQIV